jgi:hypothetical protein
MEGSTVRVRQRALQKVRIWGFSFRYHLQNQQRAVGMEPFTEPSAQNIRRHSVESDLIRA